MLLQFDLKHIHKVNFYPSDNNFTQALLVLLVTNMISVHGIALPSSDKHALYLDMCVLNFTVTTNLQNALPH